VKVAGDFVSVPHGHGDGFVAEDRLDGADPPQLELLAIQIGGMHVAQRRSLPAPTSART
jgi:hypothetical protein